MDFDLDQEFTQIKQRKLILTESDNLQNRKEKNARQQIPLHLRISLIQGSLVAVAYEYVDGFLLAL